MIVSNDNTIEFIEERPAGNVYLYDTKGNIAFFKIKNVEFYGVGDSKTSCMYLDSKIIDLIDIDNDYVLEIIFIKSIGYDTNSIISIFKFDNSNINKILEHKLLI